jgi:hypothetical protein
MNNPLANNPLRERSDFQRAARDLFAPLVARFSRGGALARLGVMGATYSERAAALEGFARPLWGVAALAAGGGAFSHWELLRAGLIHGSDPSHPEYWGECADYDQRMVEMAPLSFALLTAADQLWTPLPDRAKQNLADWLARSNRPAIPDNNWLFFRVLTNLAVYRLTGRLDRARTDACLERLEQFYVGDGWYTDGPRRQLDYYIPSELHFFGLLYAKLAGQEDPDRAGRFRERASRFAQDFIHWFAADGAALPYGRSLTYRFDQASFWGALAFAGLEALPWGVLRGLWARHLRWWAARPIFTDGGLLSIGYAYPNLFMSETYNSPASPYWAMKFFLPLTLPATHPFWQADEAPLPSLPSIVVQPHPGFLIYRADPTGHVVALAGGQQHHGGLRHAAEKYAKLAYSTAFGFSVPTGTVTAALGAHDNMLALSDDDRYFRVRHETVATAIDGESLYARWQPWPDVEVETWLAPAPPWHVRLHRLRTRRKLISLEGGFAVAISEPDAAGPQPVAVAGAGRALAGGGAGFSGVRDLNGDRAGQLVAASANSNLLHPRAQIPSLRGTHEPGEHWLACAALGLAGPDRPDRDWEQPPRLHWNGATPEIRPAGKDLVVLRPRSG